jgi:hypothetical protein
MLAECINTHANKDCDFLLIQPLISQIIILTLPVHTCIDPVINELKPYALIFDNLNNKPHALLPPLD